MHLLKTIGIGAIACLLALSSASPLLSEDVPEGLVKRACPADCNNKYPLARKLGKPCGGSCDKTYKAGSETCSCNLGAIVSQPLPFTTDVLHMMLLRKVLI